HWGQKIGDDTNNDVYLDELSNKDFSDIRFLSQDNKLLDAYKASVGNYELIPDRSLQRYMVPLSDGSIAGSTFEENGIFMSYDGGKTWTNVIPIGQITGRNQLDDIFYDFGKDLWMATKASGYTTRTKVIEITEFDDCFWRIHSFAMDDAGNLYAGQY